MTTKALKDAIQIVPTADRAAVGMMLAGLDGAIDVIVPALERMMQDCAPLGRLRARLGDLDAELN